MRDADEDAERVLIERERMLLKAPFPWFGGKSRVAAMVWERFGAVDNYVEPFAGSLAVLLGRPDDPGTETVNDLDCYVANFWRALAMDPEGVAEHANWPVNEADLHGRHLWLVNQAEFRERMKTDPEFHDVKVAGWWVWGISQWIGAGWCSRPEWRGRTNAGGHNKGDGGRGVSRKLPHCGGGGRGVFADRVADKRPQLSGRGTGNGVRGDKIGEGLLDYMKALAARLRRVRVCCGDWARVTGPSVTIKHGVCGVFLDPPYDMRVVSDAGSGGDGAAPSDGIYAHHDNNVSAAVRSWAVENGGNPLLRIALCGYEGEHAMPADWECVPWKAHGGYGAQRGGHGNENAARERIWFSRACVRQAGLFDRLPADLPR